MCANKLRNLRSNSRIRRRHPHPRASNEPVVSKSLNHPNVWLSLFLGPILGIQDLKFKHGSQVDSSIVVLLAVFLAIVLEALAKCLIVSDVSCICSCCEPRCNSCHVRSWLFCCLGSSCCLCDMCLLLGKHGMLVLVSSALRLAQSLLMFHNTVLYGCTVLRSTVLCRCCNYRCCHCLPEVQNSARLSHAPVSFRLARGAATTNFAIVNSAPLS